LDFDATMPRIGAMNMILHASSRRKSSTKIPGRGTQRRRRKL
jgi:hypothetical protein